jgi:hypothetical protein
VRILVLVMCSDGKHSQMSAAVRRTWGQDSRDDFKVLYHYGWRETGTRPVEGLTIPVGDTLLCGVSDKWECCLPKRLMAFDYARSNYAYDYVYAVCDGSYLDRDGLLEWASCKPSEGLYAGVNGPYRGSTWRYASGSGWLMSPDVVNLLADNAPEVLSWDPSIHKFDDVCIGHFLDTRGVRPVDAPRVDGVLSMPPGNFHWHFPLAPEKFDAIRALLKGQSRP